MGRIYGYCRISRKTQSIDRQIRNIKERYPQAIIVQETYTGTSFNRPVWSKLNRQLRKDDTVVFDSVSRMSRDAKEGSQTYTDLYDRGVDLIFIKEPYIDTATYKKALEGKVAMTGTDIDPILEGVNRYLLRLANDQIVLAFEQAEKEVTDLRQRTKEGIETARLAGKQIGSVRGSHYRTKTGDAARAGIIRYSRDFNGSLTDKDVIRLLGISHNTYYKYKRLLKQEAAQTGQFLQTKDAEQT